MSTTGRLLMVVGLLGALDLAVRWPREDDAAPWVAPAFDMGLVDRIEVGQVASPTVLLRRGDGWWLASGERADDAAIDGLLAALDGGLVADARVDDADPAAHGLAGGRERRLALFAGDRPVLRLLVGDDAGAGHTWVRAVDDDALAQVRLGGRSRLEGDWRARQLWSLDPAAITEVDVRVGDARWRATREGGAWFGADGPGTERLLYTLEGLRVRSWTASVPSEEPWAELVLSPAGTLRLWRTVGESAAIVDVIAERRDATSTVRARLRPADVAFVEGLPALELHSLYRDDWQAVERVVLEGPIGRGVLEANDGGWTIREPVGVQAPARRLEAVVRFAASPRLLRPDPDAGQRMTSRGKARRVWRITSSDGTREVWLGDQTPQGVPVRTADGRASGWIDARLISAVDAVFGLLPPTDGDGGSPGG